jgi:hypothetical protein
MRARSFGLTCGSLKPNYNVSRQAWFSNRFDCHSNGEYHLAFEMTARDRATTETRWYREPRVTIP